MSDAQFDEVLFNDALAYLQRNHAEFLTAGRVQVLVRCVVDLQRRHEISRQHAEDIAIRAYGEVSSSGVREYVDLSRTTSHLITLRDPATGVMRMLTISDLLSLIGPARVPKPKLVTTH